MNSFYSWLQQIDWVHFVALGIVFSLISLIHSIDDKSRKQTETAQLLPEAPPLANNATSKSKSSRFHIRTLFPVLRWTLFFAAVLVVLIGIQDMYAALNPPASFVRGVSIRNEPDISWTGAIFTATGIAILWFGRQWWSKKSTTQH